MRALHRIGILVASVAFIRCGAGGPDTITISVADHSDALTTGASDNVFVLTLVSATKGYVLNDITVSAGLPGQTETAVNYTHDDTNANGTLDQGETLTCKEPPVNLFDPSTVGKAVNVNFAEKSDGTYFQIGHTTWTPTN